MRSEGRAGACGRSLGGTASSLRGDLRHIFKEWESGGQKKIVIRLQNIHEIYALKAQCEELGLFTTIVTDAGKTQVDPGTVTCIGIGPAPEEMIDIITSKYPLL